MGGFLPAALSMLSNWSWIKLRASDISGGGSNAGAARGVVSGNGLLDGTVAKECDAGIMAEGVKPAAEREGTGWDLEVRALSSKEGEGAGPPVAAAERRASAPPTLTSLLIRPRRELRPAPLPNPPLDDKAGGLPDAI